MMGGLGNLVGAFSPCVVQKTRFNCSKKRNTFDKAADGSFVARVATDGRVPTASENSAAAALTIALARAIGIDVGGLD